MPGQEDMDPVALSQEEREQAGFLFFTGM